MREKKKNRKDYQKDFTKSLSTQLETNGATREAYSFKWHLWSQSLPCTSYHLHRWHRSYVFSLKQPVALFWEVTEASLFWSQNNFPLLVFLFWKQLSSTSLWGGKRRKGQFVTSKKEIMTTRLDKLKSLSSKGCIRKHQQNSYGKNQTCFTLVWIKLGILLMEFF